LVSRFWASAVLSPLGGTTGMPRASPPGADFESLAESGLVEKTSVPLEWSSIIVRIFICQRAKGTHCNDTYNKSKPRKFGSHFNSTKGKNNREEIPDLQLHVINSQLIYRICKQKTYFLQLVGQSDHHRGH
jgi:hypothetical protein